MATLSSPGRRAFNTAQGCGYRTTDIGQSQHRRRAAPSTAAVNALGTDQVAALTSTQVGALTSTQSAALNTAQNGRHRNHRRQPAQRTAAVP